MYSIRSGGITMAEPHSRESQELVQQILLYAAHFLMRSLAKLALELRLFPQ